MLALVDGDIVAYRCAASAQQDPEWIANARAKELMEQILGAVRATEYRVFLSGSRSFRKEMYPQYKANRTQPPPIHLAACKQYLVNDWQAVWTADGIEADDALGIAQVSVDSSIICSIDKDLKQIPGLHYNFVKREFDTVDEKQGWYNFYIQMLVGDSADNIRGCPGIGKAKAPKILAGCSTVQEMFDACRNTYNDDESMFMNGQLLYIWRKEQDHWDYKKLLEQEQKLESTPQTAEGITPFMELGGTS